MINTSTSGITENLEEWVEFKGDLFKRYWQVFYKEKLNSVLLNYVQLYVTFLFIRLSFVEKHREKLRINILLTKYVGSLKIYLHSIRFRDE